MARYLRLRDLLKAQPELAPIVVDAAESNLDRTDGAAVTRLLGHVCQMLTED